MDLKNIVGQTLEDNLKKDKTKISKDNTDSGAESVDFVEPSDMKDRVEKATSIKANLSSDQ